MQKYKQMQFSHKVVFSISACTDGTLVGLFFFLLSNSNVVGLDKTKEVWTGLFDGHFFLPLFVLLLVCLRSLASHFRSLTTQSKFLFSTHATLLLGFLLFFFRGCKFLGLLFRSFFTSFFH